MKVARYMEPGRIVVEETERPVISDGEVLVRMRACGVCGTDVKTYQRGHPLIQPGSVLGHEVAGDVVESRHPRFGVDMRVAVAPYTSCGECAECRRGHPSLCSNRGEAFLQPGGFAEFLRVPRRLADVGLYHVPDGMSYEVASLAEPLACCVHGLEALSLVREGSLLIIGDGPMGLLQAAIAKSCGAARVALVGLTPQRLEFARSVADAVIDGSDPDAGRALQACAPGGFDGVMVSVASLEALDQAMRVVARGGAVNVFAGMPSGVTYSLDLKRVHYDEVRVVGTFGFGPDDFVRALELLGQIQTRLEGFITDRVGLEQVEAALQNAAQHACVKSVVVAAALE